MGKQGQGLTPHLDGLDGTLSPNEITTTYTGHRPTWIAQLGIAVRTYVWDNTCVERVITISSSKGP